MTIEEQLDKVLHENYRRAGEETGYWGRYFLRELKKKGGVATLKRMLLPAKSVVVPDGLQALIDAGRTDLSIEATAIESRFRRLFTEAELSEAQRRLDDLPAFVRRRPTDKTDLHPTEVPEDTTFTEGAVRRVVVNAFERDRAARTACIAKFGIRCSACEMSFLERYGEIGRGFIHVHHKKPLAIRRAEYELRPTIDLVPVCPNCHAMLHTQNPPLSIEELRTIIHRPSKGEQ